MDGTRLNYAVNLPEDIRNILDQDFWMMENVGAQVVRTALDPMKFESTVSVFLMRGEASIEIDLIHYDIEAPSLIHIRSGQILQISGCSDDLSLSFIVMSRKFADSIVLLINNPRLAVIDRISPCKKLPATEVYYYTQLYSQIRKLSQNKENPYSYKAVAFCLTSFFCGYAYRHYLTDGKTMHSAQERISKEFMALVHDNFRQQRFLDFYAGKMDISAKHLSRTLKQVTGLTAVEWIERHVVLEAKVLLKSTDRTIQQISDELSFHSQSFFTQYFKKHVGMTPKEYRSQ